MTLVGHRTSLWDRIIDETLLFVVKVFRRFLKSAICRLSLIAMEGTSRLKPSKFLNLVKNIGYETAKSLNIIAMILRKQYFLKRCTVLTRSVLQEDSTVELGQFIHLSVIK